MNASRLNGDIYVSSKAYKAVTDAILGTADADNGGSFAEDFRALCKNSTRVPGGCAVMGFEVSGGDNREISTYAFQVLSVALA